ncbi:MAG: pyridoxamine 5'-phosphate oxidase family protein [Planctomycetota bacterium]
MNENQKHFKEILESFSTAMLITVGSNGKPHGRPMQVAHIDDAQTVWFFTNLSSEKVGEILDNSTVGITMQGGGKFLSLYGTAKIENNQQVIDQLWTDTNKVWFPEGKDSPMVTLIAVDPSEGEYWDVSGLTGIQYLYEAGKAYFQETGIDTQGLDVNEKVKL